MSMMLGCAGGVFRRETGGALGGEREHFMPIQLLGG